MCTKHMLVYTFVICIQQKTTSEIKEGEQNLWTTSVWVNVNCKSIDMIQSYKDLHDDENHISRYWIKKNGTLSVNRLAWLTYFSNQSILQDDIGSSLVRVYTVSCW